MNYKQARAQAHLQRDKFVVICVCAPLNRNQEFPFVHRIDMGNEAIETGTQVKVLGFASKSDVTRQVAHHNLMCCGQHVRAIVE